MPRIFNIALQGEDDDEADAIEYLERFAARRKVNVNRAAKILFVETAAAALRLEDADET